MDISGFYNNERKIIREMSMGQEVRLHQFYDIDKKAAAELLIPFHNRAAVDEVIPIHKGMSTSNYCIVSGTTK
jgi:phage-related protein